MYCTNCGREVAPGSSYCTSCGKAIGNAAALMTVYASEERANSAYAAEANRTASQPAPQFPEYPDGCAGAAWKDVKASNGWLGRSALMALVMLVPILNFFVTGYLMKWAGEAARGVRREMPKKIFADGAFGLGFLGIVVGIVFGAIYFVVALVLCLIPFVGLIALAVSPVFVSMFSMLCLMRVAMSGRLGPAFDFSSTWRAYKRKLGSLFGACFIPGILSALVMTGIVLVVSLVFGIIAFAACGIDPGTFAGMANGHAPHMSSSAAVALLFLLFVYVIAVYLPMFWVLIAGSMVAYRAVGIWVDRYASEWKTDPRLAPNYGMPSASSGNAAAPAGGYAQSAPAAAAAAPVAATGARASHTPAPECAATPANTSSNTPAAQPQSAYRPAPAAVVAESEFTGPVIGSTGNPNGGETEVLAAFDEADYDTSVMSEPRITVAMRSGESIEIRSLPAVLGRGSNADVNISNSSVSRRHARIYRTGDGLAIEDLNAANKTYLNGVVLVPGKAYALESGAELKLGNEVLAVRVD